MPEKAKEAKKTTKPKKIKKKFINPQRLKKPKKPKSSRKA